MNKPIILSATSGQVASAPSTLVQQPVPANTIIGRAAIPATRPTQQVAVPEYVDPYLFETGYYASPAEEQELAHAAAARIRLRADVENARPKRRS